MIHTTPFRLVALVLVGVLLVVAGTPARAEAIEALTIVRAGLAWRDRAHHLSRRRERGGRQARVRAGGLGRVRGRRRLRDHPGQVAAA
jgi:hypothetical protein